VSKGKYKDVFQSNCDYDVNEDFANTLKQAESGDEKAMYVIANMYFYGFTNENGQSDRDFSRAYSWFTKLSSSSSIYGVLATSMLGKMHYRGVVPKEKQSYVKSFKCHKKAAQGGGEYSKQQYAYMLSVGMGCDFDYDAAEQQYLSAIKHGDNISISGLAKFYLQYGEFKKAENLYKDIVDTYPMAAYELGCLYMKGLLSDDKKPDCFRAAFYFQHAINTGNGDIDARFQLGLLYFRGTNGFINDYKIAQENFEIAADNGHVDSAYMMGYMYEHGHVEMNLEKAIHYHALAADHGHVLSPTHLAILYQLPKHQNYQKAVEYAKLAASYGEKEGEFVYGNLLFFGRGCEPNNDEAYKMYKRALEHGCDQAAFMIEKIELRQLAEKNKL
jgi:TPR repeat protein